MRLVPGLLLCLLGIAVGLYLGVYVFLAGGIMQIVRGVTAEPASRADVAWGIIKMLCAGPVGCNGLLFFMPGLRCLSRARRG